MIAGMRGGQVDFVIMRLVDAVWAFPRMLFAIMLLTVLGSGFGNVLLAIAVTGLDSDLPADAGAASQPTRAAITSSRHELSAPLRTASLAFTSCRTFWGQSS